MLFTKTLPERDARGVDALRTAGPRRHEQAVPSLDDLKAATWVKAYGSAWLGGRWRELEKMLAPDVTLMSTDSTDAVEGREAVLDHLRRLRQRACVHDYAVAEMKGYVSGSVGVITYRWQLDWTVAVERRSGTGDDILVLRPAGRGWQLSWRGQTVRRRPGAIVHSSWPGSRD